MRRTSETRATPDQIVRNIRRTTRKRHSTEEKIRVVLEGLRGEYGTDELCRRDFIAESPCHSGSKKFLQAVGLPKSLKDLALRTTIRQCLTD